MAYTTIDNPELYFQVALYTGNYSTQSITLPGSEDMQPDMVWIKERDGTSSHALQDSVRGTGSKLMPNASDAESTGETAYITSFDSDGFSIGANNGINQDGILNVAWCWKEASGIFDIVTYTGNGSGRTISHSLSAVPHLYIVKGRTWAENWMVYHHKNTSAPETDYLEMSLTSATADNVDRFNDTAPTSSVFSVGSGDGTNKNTYTYVAYLWSEKQGFSKFGSYTGNGNADGTFIYTGFRPAWFLCKNTQDAGDNWILHDNKRDTFNVTDNGLAPNDSTAEFTDVDMDFLSNGVKMRNNTGRANSAKTFIYMAFAEAPFVNSKGVPCNAR